MAAPQLCYKGHLLYVQLKSDLPRRPGQKQGSKSACLPWVALRDCEIQILSLTIVAPFLTVPQVERVAICC